MSDDHSAKAAAAKAQLSLDPDEVENHLSTAFYNLNVQGREEINEEVHGVTCLAPEESPEMIKNSLIQLSEELDSIRVKPAFDRCQQLLEERRLQGFRISSYVNSDELRLRFLRAELFDPKKAARRLVMYLDFLMTLFNGKEELLLRQLRLSDLDRRDVAILKNGNFQLLPYRDRSGRRIMVIIVNLAVASQFKATIKIVVYLMTVASESVESQRKGIVKIVHPTNPSDFGKSFPGPEDRKWAGVMNSSMPIRLVAFHICAPDSLFFRLFRALIIITKSGDQKYRVLTHFGSYTEWQYTLMGYGIPVDLLPVSPTGTVKVLLHQQWIKVRKMIENGVPVKEPKNSDSDESAAVPNSAIECPNLNDVVFRPGKSYMCHPGNVMFRSLIEAKMEEHYSGSRSDKAAIAWTIVHEVEERGGRFLKWDSRGWWTEFDDPSEIRYKVPTYFRDFSRKKKAKKLNRKPQPNRDTTSNSKI